MLNITFPVFINVGNKTIERTVVVPLDIAGEVEKIEVYPIGRKQAYLLLKT